MIVRGVEAVEVLSLPAHLLSSSAEEELVVDLETATVEQERPRELDGLEVAGGYLDCSFWKQEIALFLLFPDWLVTVAHCLRAW